MQKTILGKTGEEVSILGFGCMRLPLRGPKASDIDYPLAEAMLRKAVDGGVNYIDTAYPYHNAAGPGGPGESEVWLGRALAGGYREKVNLATKLPTWLVKSKKEMHAVLDSQLKRLQTTHIDFYLAHSLKSGVWENMLQAGMLEFLDEARRDGRIRHVGFSFHDIYSVFEDIIKSYDWEFAQIQYNYLDTEYQAGQRGARLAKERGLGLVVMEPLRGGFLVNHMPDDLRAVLAGARPDWSMADWGFRWLWSRAEVDLVLSGMNAMDQVEENLAIASAPGRLNDADFAAAAEVRAGLRARLPVDCTACGYCLPCPNGVKIPVNFSVYNNYFLMDADSVRQRAKSMYKFQLNEDERASRCLHCRECEDKCPQHLPISDNMEKVAALMES